MRLAVDWSNIRLPATRLTIDYHPAPIPPRPVGIPHSGYCSIPMILLS